MRARPEGRVILLGANGATGRLTAAAMVRQGLEPVLAGRNEVQLRDLAEELSEGTVSGGAPEVALADTADPTSVRGLVGSTGDVLVSCVGSFTTQGDPVAAAAADAGAATSTAPGSRRSSVGCSAHSAR